jgi:hypothetical protein
VLHIGGTDCFAAIQTQPEVQCRSRKGGGLFSPCLMQLKHYNTEGVIQQNDFCSTTKTIFAAMQIDIFVMAKA